MPFIPDFVDGQPILFCTAGDTFAYSGQITALDNDVAWGMSATFVAHDSGTVVATSEGMTPDVAVTMTRANDYVTSGAWDISILALAAVTATWATATVGATPLLLFDLKFFNTANPDPVLHSTTIYVGVRTAITP